MRDIWCACAIISLKGMQFLNPESKGTCQQCSTFPQAQLVVNDTTDSKRCEGSYAAVLWSLVLLCAAQLCI
jgi:hypothetical protein